MATPGHEAGHHERFIVTQSLTEPSVSSLKLIPVATHWVAGEILLLDRQDSHWVGRGGPELVVAAAVRPGLTFGTSVAASLVVLTTASLI